MAVQRQLRVLDASTDSDADAACLRVGFATLDLKTVNQHFGSAERFAIYAVDPKGATLLEVAEFGDLAQDGNENKLIEKFSILHGCAAVYSQAIGGSAVRQLLGIGVQPLKVTEGTPIAQLIEELQAELAEQPGGWVARALKRTSSRGAERFDEMEDEGWLE